jgi:hypothetical protein
MKQNKKPIAILRIEIQFVQKIAYSGSAYSVFYTFTAFTKIMKSGQ